MRPTMSRQLALLACSAFALGCSDSLAPEDVAGLYVLERIGSRALPAVLWQNEYQVVRVTSGAILLRADGTGTLSSVEEFIPRQEGLSTTPPRSSDRAFGFRTVGARIEIGFPCPPNAGCLAPPHMIARRTLRGLAVNWARSSTRLHYARVASASPH